LRTSCSGGDGRILTSQLNAAGTTRIVEGAPPFQLVIGNSQHVHLSYRERPIDLSPYARLDVARLRLE
jgi:cytoskeleton protein RodZ